MLQPEKRSVHGVHTGIEIEKRAAEHGVAAT